MCLVLIPKYLWIDEKETPRKEGIKEERRERETDIQKKMSNIGR